MGSRVTGHPVRALAVVGACLLLAAAVTASALGSEQPEGSSNLKIHFGGLTEPSKLSPAKPTPIDLRLEGSAVMRDGSVPPPLASLSLSFDRSGSIFTKGLPTCSRAELERQTEALRPPCHDALVGHGVVVVEFHFPEGNFSYCRCVLRIFNGRPESGRPTFIYILYAHVPAATTFLATGKILASRGRFGSATAIRIPNIAQGHGSIESFDLRLGRTWIYNGKKVSLLSARCPRGQLAAKAELEFVNGERAADEIEKKCA